MQSSCSFFHLLIQLDCHGYVIHVKPSFGMKQLVPCAPSPFPKKHIRCFSYGFCQKSTSRRQLGELSVRHTDGLLNIQLLDRSIVCALFLHA